MDLIIGIMLVILSAITCTAIINTFTFPRLSARIQSGGQPLVSVMIPVRNEKDIIRETVKNWQGNNYPNIELIILDDCSTDGTDELLREIKGNDERLRVVTGAPLPTGWKGKNWACHQMAQIAYGDIFLFTDADVHWDATALGALLFEMVRSKSDLLTVWPTQQTHSWTERLIIPLLGFVVLGYLPYPAVSRLQWPIFAAANGQCLVFNGHVYTAIGGHAAVRANLVEDMALARLIKKSGYKLSCADGGGLISAKMYQGWSDVRDGFAKNIKAGHGDSIVLLLLSTIFHWALFVFPWIWILIRPQQGLLLAAIGVLIRALTAAATRQRILDGIFLPISVFLMTIISVRSIRWSLRGEVKWKGRTYET